MYLKALISRFLHWFSVGIMFPILTLALISKGVAIENVAFVTAIGSVIILILEFPSGVISDHLGRKKIYLFSLIVDIIAFIFFGFANSTLAIIFCFSTYAVGKSFSSGSIESLFIDQYIEKQGKDATHRIVALLQASQVTGLCVGALCGGLVPRIWEMLCPDHNKFNGNFALVVIIKILILIMITFSVKEKHEHKESLLGQLKDFFRMMKIKKVLCLMMLVSIVWGFVFNTIELYWQPQLKSIIHSDGKIWIFGLINSGYFLAALVGTALVGLILKKTKMNHFVLIMLVKVLIGVFIVILSAQHSLCGFTVIYLTMFMFNGMGNIIEKTILNKQVTPEHRSSLLSAVSFSVQIGAIMGGLLSTVIIRLHSISMIWLITGIIFTFSSIIFVFVKKLSIEAK